MTVENKCNTDENNGEDKTKGSQMHLIRRFTGGYLGRCRWPHTLYQRFHLIDFEGQRIDVRFGHETDALHEEKVSNEFIVEFHGVHLRWETREEIPPEQLDVDVLSGEDGQRVVEDAVHVGVVAASVDIRGEAANDEEQLEKHAIAGVGMNDLNALEETAGQVGVEEIGDGVEQILRDVRREHGFVDRERHAEMIADQADLVEDREAVEFGYQLEIVHQSLLSGGVIVEQTVNGRVLQGGKRR